VIIASIIRAKISVNIYQTTRSSIPKGSHLNACCSESLKSHQTFNLFVFCVVTPYGPLGRYQRFRELYCLHLQGDLGEGGSMFLRNLCIYLQVHTALLPPKANIEIFTIVRTSDWYFYAHKYKKNRNMWYSKFSRRRVWSSELSSGMYCRVK
jgi:hypothetical protein